MRIISITSTTVARFLLYQILFLWSLNGWASSSFPLYTGSVHSPAHSSANPSDIATAASLRKIKPIYGLQFHSQASLYNYKNNLDLSENLKSIIKDNSIDISKIDTFEQSLNNYLVQTYQAKASVYSNLQFIIPTQGKNTKIGIQNHSMASQRTLIGSGVNVRTAASQNLINAAADTTLSATAFLDSIENNAGLINSFVSINTLYISQSMYFKIEKKLKLSAGIKLKFSRFKLSENLYPLTTILHSFTSKNESIGLDSIEDFSGKFDTTKDLYSSNLDVGMGAYTQNIHFGLYVNNLFSQDILFPTFAQTCDNTDKVACTLANTFYSDRSNYLAIRPRFRSEVSYFTTKWNLSIMSDLSPWLDYDKKNNQYTKISVGSNSITSRNRIAGHPSPSLNFSYLINAVREEHYFTIGATIWSIYFNLSVSKEFLKELNFNQGSVTERFYHLAFNLGFSNL